MEIFLDTRELINIFDDLYKTWNTPSLSIKIEGNIKLDYYTGVTKIVDGQSVNSHTFFPIGCCTKTITAFASMLLAEQGRIGLDIPIKHYIPELCLNDEYVTKNITLRDIILMRTGLPIYDDVWQNRKNTFQNITSSLDQYRLEIPFRYKFKYSVLYHNIIDLLFARITKLNFKEYIEKNLFEPLQINNTFFSWDEVVGNNKSYPYDFANNQYVSLDYVKLENILPAAGIISNCHDSVKILGLFSPSEKSIISKKFIGEILRPQIYTNLKPRYKEISYQSYALGWFYEPYQNTDVFYHEGNAPGFSSLYALIPDYNIRIVTYTNMDKSLLPKTVLYTVINKLVNNLDVDWSKRMKLEMKIKRGFFDDKRY